MHLFYFTTDTTESRWANTLALAAKSRVRLRDQVGVKTPMLPPPQLIKAPELIIHLSGLCLLYKSAVNYKIFSLQRAGSDWI